MAADSADMPDRTTPEAPVDDYALRLARSRQQSEPTPFNVAHPLDRCPLPNVARSPSRRADGGLVVRETQERLRVDAVQLQRTRVERVAVRSTEGPRLG